MLSPWLFAVVLLLAVVDGCLYFESRRKEASMQERQENRVAFIGTLALTLLLCAAGLVPGGWK